MVKQSFNADITDLPDILDFVSEELKRYNVPEKKIIQSILTIEEICVSLIEHITNTEPKQKKIHLKVKNFLGKISVYIRCPGDSFTLFEKKNEELLANISSENDTFVESPEVESLLRRNILSAFHRDIRFDNKRNINNVIFTVTKQKISRISLTLFALASSIIFGYLLSTVIPQNITQLIDSYFLIPVKTMFFNSLRMVVAPVVFFSIVSCVSQFSDISEFGRIGGKILLFFFGSTILAILCGMAVYFLLSPGGNMYNLVPENSGMMSNQETLSILNLIIGAVPSNFVNAFLKNNVLQIIFLAVLCGIGVNKIGEYSVTLNNFFSACNKLFLAILSIIIKLIPLSVFCSISSLIVNSGMDKLLPLIALIGAFLVGCVFLIGLYLTEIYVIGHITPRTFLRKYLKTFLITFPLTSSIASMPYNIAFCRDEAGVDPKLYSFSIPLGTSANMTGNCVYFSLTCLFCMHLFAIPITTPILFTLGVSIFIITLGTPGIPGGCIVALSVLLQQIGVPLEAVGIVMGIEPIFILLRPLFNSLSTIAVTLAIARHDNLMDREKFNS